MEGKKIAHTQMITHWEKKVSFTPTYTVRHILKRFLYEGKKNIMYNCDSQGLYVSNYINLNSFVLIVFRMEMALVTSSHELVRVLFS